MDSVTQKRIQLLHPKLRDEVTFLVNQANAHLTKHSEVRIVQALRTIEEQNELYAQGRTKAGKKVTNAKGLFSNHNYGLALDFALLIGDKQISWDIKKDWDGDKISDWMEVVNVFRRAGFEWGGTWKFQDNPHLQKTFGLSVAQLRAKYLNGDTIIDANGIKYVNI